MTVGPLKILFVVHGFPPEFSGGTEFYCVAAAKALAARGHTVEILAGSAKAEPAATVVTTEFEGLTVHRLHRRGLFLDGWDRSFDPEAEARFREVLRSFVPDVVHVHHWIRLTRTLVATATAADIPAIVTLHDLWSTCPRCFRIRDETFCERDQGPESCFGCAPTDPWSSEQSTKAELASFRDDLIQELRLATVCLAPSKVHGALVAEKTGLPRGAIRVLPHGAIVSGLAPARPSTDGIVRLGHWGHLYPMKGFHLLLEAMRTLGEEERQRFQIHCFGVAFDDDYKQRLEELAAHLPVVWHGPYRPADLSAAPLDWAVLPGLAHESYSFVLDEAFALGLPVIVPRRGALGERVHEGGICFEPESVTSLADALRRVLLEEGLATRCRENTPSLWSMDHHVQRLESVYRDALVRAGDLGMPSERLTSQRVISLLARTEERFAALLDLRGRLATERTTRENLESQFDEAARSVRDNEASRAAFASSVDELKQELERREIVLSGFETSLAALKHEVSVKEARLSEYEASIALFSARLEERASDVNALETAREEAFAALFELRSAYDALIEERDGLRADLQSLALDRDRFRDMVATQEESLDAYRVSTSALDRERQEWRRRGEEGACALEELRIVMNRALESERVLLAQLNEAEERASTLEEERRHLDAGLRGEERLTQDLRRSVRHHGRELARVEAELTRTEAARVDAVKYGAEVEARRTVAEAEVARLSHAAAALMAEVGLPDDALTDVGHGALSLAQAIFGMTQQLTETTADLERLREERDAHAAARAGAEVRAKALVQHLEDVERRWWVPPFLRRRDQDELRRATGRLRILTVVHQFLPRHAAGSEIYTYKLAKALQERHDVHLLFTEAHFGIPQYRTRQGIYEGLPFTEVVHQHDPRSFERTWRDPRMESIFERVLDRVQPDLVHFQHSYYFGIGCIERAKARGLPVIHTLHEYLLLCPRGGQMRRADGELCYKPVKEKCAECIRHYHLDTADDDEGQPKLWQRVARHVPEGARRLLKELLPPAIPDDATPDHPVKDYEEAIATRLSAVTQMAGSVDLFISPSRFLRDRFIEAGVVDPDQIIFSDNGMDTAPFAAKKRTPSNVLRVGFIGSIAEYKGVHVLVDAMNRLIDDPGIECHVFGKLETFPDYAVQLRELAQNPRTIFHGAYDNKEIGRVLSGLDAICVPSLWFENSPLTIHEAYLAGIPVLASDLGGMIEYVEHEVSGLRFRPGDPLDLAAQIRRLRSEVGLLERLMSRRVPIKTIEEDAMDMEGRYRRLVDLETQKRGSTP